MSSPKMHDRSARKAGAVRDRSASTLRCSSVFAWAEFAPLSRRSFFASLTPARWRDHEFGWRISGRRWVRGVVLWGTASEPLENAEAIDITSLIERFRWFPVFGGRYMHTRAYVRARVYVRGVNQGTREPQDYFFRGQEVSSSLSGSEAVPQRTALVCLVLPIGTLDILAGGNAAQLIDLVEIGRSGVSIGGEWGEVFGFFAAGELGLVVEVARMRAEGRNGGILRFSRAGSGLVGSPVLEGWQKTEQRQYVVRGEHLPSRLARAALVQLVDATLPPRSRAQAARPTPPCPHLRRRISLSPWRAIVSEFGTAIGPAEPRRRAPERLPASRAGAARSREGLSGATGSGCRAARVVAGEPAAGRGMGRGMAGLKGSALRRTVEASGRAAHVN